MEHTDLTDTGAMITGATSGMGLLAAQRFVEGGASVVLVDANQEAVIAAAVASREARPGSWCPGLIPPTFTPQGAF